MADDSARNRIVLFGGAPGRPRSSTIPGTATSLTSIEEINYDGASIAALPNFSMTAFPTYYGARPGGGALSPDSRPDLLATAGPDPSAPSTNKSHDDTGTALVPLNSFTPFGTATRGANVTGAALGYRAPWRTP